MIDLTDYRGVYFTPQEAADYIGISLSRIYQMLNSGEISAVKFSERYCLVSQKEADRIKESPASTGRPRERRRAG